MTCGPRAQTILANLAMDHIFPRTNLSKWCQQATVRGSRCCGLRQIHSFTRALSRSLVICVRNLSSGPRDPANEPLLFRAFRPTNRMSVCCYDHALLRSLRSTTHRTVDYSSTTKATESVGTTNGGDVTGTDWLEIYRMRLTAATFVLTPCFVYCTSGFVFMCFPRCLTHCTCN